MISPGKTNPVQSLIEGVAASRSMHHYPTHAHGRRRKLTGAVPTPVQPSSQTIQGRSIAGATLGTRIPHSPLRESQSTRGASRAEIYLEALLALGIVTFLI